MNEPLPGTGEPVDPRVSQRVRANDATVAVGRIVAAGRARDIDAIAAAFAEGYCEDFDPAARSRFGVLPEGARRLSRENALAGLARIFELADFSLEIEILATLGSSLDLHRTTTSGTRPQGGTGNLTSIMIGVGEADARGRLVHLDVYEPTRMRMAVERIYGLFASSLPPGPQRDAAEFASSFQPIHEALVELGAVDHDGEVIVEDVLVLDGDAHILQFVSRSAGTAAHARDRRFSCLAYFSGGRLRCVEAYESERSIEALARLEDLRTQFIQGQGGSARIATTRQGERKDHE